MDGRRVETEDLVSSSDPLCRPQQESLHHVAGATCPTMCFKMEISNGCDFLESHWVPQLFKACLIFEVHIYRKMLYCARFEFRKIWENDKDVEWKIKEVLLGTL